MSMPMSIPISIPININTSIYLNQCLNNCISNIEFENENKNILQMDLYVENKFKKSGNINIVFKDLVLAVFTDIGDEILYTGDKCNYVNDINIINEKIQYIKSCYKINKINDVLYFHKKIDAHYDEVKFKNKKFISIKPNYCHGGFQCLLLKNKIIIQSEDYLLELDKNINEFINDIEKNKYLTFGVFNEKFIFSNNKIYSFKV